MRLLQRARCTLFPIAWEEPFGLVMIESMACGTPVVATRWGAVPEVIGDGGEGGIVVDDLEAMVGAVAAADEIDPAACRAYVEERFSERRMVRNYLEAFRLLLEEQGRPPRRAASASRAAGRDLEVGRQAQGRRQPLHRPLERAPGRPALPVDGEGPHERRPCGRCARRRARRGGRRRAAAARSSRSGAPCGRV